jgi:hypothetical protein
LPLQRLETIVAKNLAAEAKKRRVKLDVQTRAEALIMILFQHKVTYSGSSNREMEDVNRYFSDWLQNTFPKMKQKPALKA